jgi:hypothetical protein
MLNRDTDLRPCLEGGNSKKTEEDEEERENQGQIGPSFSSPLIWEDLYGPDRRCGQRHLQTV